MASPETEVYRDSFVNWVRFNHRDLFNLACFVGVCAILLGLAWVGDVIAHHLLYVPPCGTANPTCATHPLSHLPPYHGPGPTIPAYTPPT